MEMADDNSSVIVDSDKSPSVSGTEADAESESYLDSSLVTGDIQSDSSLVKSCSLYGCIFFVQCASITIVFFILSWEK